MAKKPAEKNEEPNPTVLLVYVGPCHANAKDRKGKVKVQVGARFFKIDDEEFKGNRLPKDPEERVFAGLGKGIGRPGTVWEFEYPKGEPNKIYGASRRWKGSLKCDEVLKWQAQSDAFQIEEKRAQLEKKDKTRNLIREQLAPIKVAYNQMVGHNRAAFLAMVIGYITGRVSSNDLRDWDDE